MCVCDDIEPIQVYESVWDFEEGGGGGELTLNMTEHKVMYNIPPWLSELIEKEWLKMDVELYWSYSNKPNCIK